jgi:UDP-N-acetylglucosamine 2-epimerase (non-hydrolysing)
LVHVEAGLRSADLQSPWPEEFNRRIASLAATLHCAPTVRAAENLMREGVDPSAIHITGNTVIDALLNTLDRERQRRDFWQARHAAWHGRRMVLITSHRRENLGDGLASICRAINALAREFPNIAWVWPLHANPQVKQQIERSLVANPNLHLLGPADYPEFVWLMDQAALILTDSGGVQEEAPSLGKPVLVLRGTTERPEAIECGAAELIGTDSTAIITRASELLSDEHAYRSMQPTQNPYGDGLAGRRIVDRLQDSTCYVCCDVA